MVAQYESRFTWNFMLRGLTISLTQMLGRAAVAGWRSRSSLPEIPGHQEKSSPRMAFSTSLVSRVMTGFVSSQHGKSSPVSIMFAAIGNPRRIHE
jgi:hypothetical protein